MHFYFTIGINTHSLRGWQCLITCTCCALRARDNHLATSCIQLSRSAQVKPTRCLIVQVDFGRKNISTGIFVTHGSLRNSCLYREQSGESASVCDGGGLAV